MAPSSLLDLIKREAGCDDDELWGVRKDEAVGRSREIRGRVVRPRKNPVVCAACCMLSPPESLLAASKKKRFLNVCCCRCAYDESDALDGLPCTSLIMQKNILIDVNQCSFFQTGDRNNSYETFLDDLQVKDGENDDCRYAVYDYDYVQEAQGTEASHR